MKPSGKNEEENQILILEQLVFRVLDQRFEHDIQIWGHREGHGLSKT